MNSTKRRRQLKAEAENLENARYLNRADIVIMTESSDDERFWKAVFNHSLSGKKVMFNYAVQPSSKGTYGKTICMKYAPFTNKHFVLAVDSDFDRIQGLQYTSFVFQTMTYSWENHYCWSQSLNSIYKGISTTGRTFEFNVFLTKLGSIIYPYMIKLLAAKKERNKSWTLDAMCSAILSVQPNKEGLLDDDGALLHEAIEDSLQQWASSLASPSSSAQDDIKMSFDNMGIKYDNAYLYMQGHCIYDMLKRIGAALTNQSASDFECQALYHNLKFDKYPEIQTLVNDIVTCIR